MRLYATVLLLLAFILACGYKPGEDPVLDAKVESICANVNEENWRTAMMDERLSAHDQCVHGVGTSATSNSGYEIFPCLFGGYPMFCSQIEGVGMNLYGASVSPQWVMRLYEGDIERHHLEIVRL
ncbi:TPA: hypothetical protein DEP96_03475 [Candidatus Uhrbacteria bacterium]|nr:hypothetical protein [Candidatus Uhrbacteria bacterium]